jgi:hypothetical protein
MDLAARGETQPKVAQASRDDEADPAHPHRCSPAADNERPTHVNPQEMEEPHQRENHAGHYIECSLIHGPILQGFRHNNSRVSAVFDARSVRSTAKRPLLV